MSARRLAVLAIALALASCRSHAPLFEAHRVASQSEAGSVHFAVLAVAPWDQYVDDLQPGFKLDADAALAKVIPSTRGQQDWLLHVFELMSGVRSTRALERSRERDAREGVEVDDDLPDAVVPPEPYFSSGDVGAPEPSEAELGEKYLRDAGYAVSDPMTQYWAATALYQEIKLLNRYVRDAAILRGYRPYLLRMQVSLIPYARGEPYDAYSTISFFCGATEEAAPSSRPQPSQGPGKDEDGGVRALTDMVAQVASGPGARNAPRVVPLMATDSLEAGVQSRTRQMMEQFALALDYFAQGLTGSARGQDLTSHLQQVVGHDLNSLLTVARVSDNTLRVRLGAMQQGSSNFAMVPRNHNITVLLMLPEGAGPTVQVVAKTTMIDAETGTPLPEHEARENEASLRAIIAFHELDGLEPKDLEEPLRCAQQNDQRAFEDAVDALLIRVARAEHRLLPHHAYTKTLWLDLVALMVGSQYSATEFDVPPPAAPEPRLVPDGVPEQTALVYDGGASGTTVVLRVAEATPFPADALRAALIVRKTGSAEVRLPEVPMELDLVHGELRGHFPSLAALGLAADGKFTGALSVVLSGAGESADLVGLYVAGNPPTPSTP